jgi:hypothetical protein
MGRIGRGQKMILSVVLKNRIQYKWSVVTYIRRLSVTIKLLRRVYSYNQFYWCLHVHKRTIPYRTCWQACDNDFNE